MNNQVVLVEGHANDASCHIVAEEWSVQASSRKVLGSGRRWTIQKLGPRDFPADLHTVLPLAGAWLWSEIPHTEASIAFFLLQAPSNVLEVLCRGERPQRGQSEVDQPCGFVGPFCNDGGVLVDPCQELDVRSILENDKLVLGGAACR